MAIMQPSRRQMLAAGLGSLVTPLMAQGRKRPNIVVILADDQGWGDLSINGNTNLSTPNIDSLARDGAMLDRFFVCPVCAPTRAEFLTGRYHPRGGVRGVSTGARAAEPRREDHRRDLQGRGLRHRRVRQMAQRHAVSLSSQCPRLRRILRLHLRPLGRYFDPPLEHNGQLVRGKGYITDDLTNHAMDFITQHKDGPFFCYLPFNTPHSPLQVPDRFFERSSTPDAKMRARDRSWRRSPFTRAVAGDVREHRLERGPRAGEARRAEAGGQHDRHLLQRQRPEQLALERRHEGAEGLDRRGRRARAVPDPLAGAHQAGDQRPADRRARSTCCRRWPTWPGFRWPATQAARRQEPQAAAARARPATGPTA